MRRQLTFFIPNVYYWISLVGGISANADRTLSSLTLLEEEPWFPFFGGMVSLGRFDHRYRVDQKMRP